MTKRDLLGLSIYIPEGNKDLNEIIREIGYSPVHIGSDFLLLY